MSELNLDERNFLIGITTEHTPTCDCIQGFRDKFPFSKHSGKKIRNEVSKIKTYLKDGKDPRNHITSPRIVLKPHIKKNEKYGGVRFFTDEQIKILSQNKSEMEVYDEFHRVFPKDLPQSFRSFKLWIYAAKFRRDADIERERKQIEKEREQKLKTTFDQRLHDMIKIPNAVTIYNSHKTKPDENVIDPESTKYIEILNEIRLHTQIMNEILQAIKETRDSTQRMVQRYEEASRIFKDSQRQKGVD
jgi:hypothetical protein